MKAFLRALENSLGGSFSAQALEEYVYEIRSIQSQGKELVIYYYLTGARSRIKHLIGQGIHIDEEVWISNGAKLLSRLRVRAGYARKIHARQTVVARIDKKTAISFQEAHHLQVPLPGKFRYGLFYKGMLVAVAVFSGGRKMNDRHASFRSYELLRFCHRGEELVIGGLSKLIKQFETEHRPGDIMTYADRDWWTRNTYESLGFNIVSYTEPQILSIHSISMENSGSVKLVKIVQKEPIIILGPTASGKTSFAVRLAKKIGGAIISVDSRQVYKGLDIGTGKDLDEYGNIPYYLIDMVEIGTHFHIAEYLKAARKAMESVYDRGLIPIFCGGTGMYLQGLLQGYAFSDVPVNNALREELGKKDIAELKTIWQELPHPPQFHADESTKKRLIRAIEIAQWIHENPDYEAQEPICPNAKVVGISIPRELRRERISLRLQKRIDEGLIKEVQSLLDRGVHPDQLLYYGLEYKYCTLFLQGKLDKAAFIEKLEVEIHRFAKRQMTYFRKMEKDGIAIQWIDKSNIDEFINNYPHCTVARHVNT